MKATYLAAINIFHSCFPEEEINEITVRQRINEIRSWKIEKHQANDEKL